MKTERLMAFLGMMLLAALATPLRAEGPTIPPAVSKIWPAGLERGTAKTFTLDGRNLTGARAVLFDAQGLSAKVLGITDIHEEIKGPRAGVDLGAAVPLGQKQEAKIEITAGPAVEPGIHWFRVETPLGTSNLLPFDVGALPEIESASPTGGNSAGQQVQLPKTIVGTIASPGQTDTFRFSGRKDEELVFQIVAAPLGSPLKSRLVLQDAQGQIIARAGDSSRLSDAVLTARLPADGDYALSVSDRDEGYGMDHFYRLHAGALPYVTSVFPLGVRAGSTPEVAVEGVNLDGVRSVKVAPPGHAEGWTTIPLRVKTPNGEALNRVKVVVGDEPEMMEKEPNNSPDAAQPIPIPATLNGHIDAAGASQADQDYFRFQARKGEHLTIEVAAARLGSPLDSLIEVLDAHGQPIPRATVRCLLKTLTTLADRDSLEEGFRLVSTSGLHENDLLMIGDEIVQLTYIPDQPDADVVVKGFGGERFSLLGTSPDVHPVNSPVYKVAVLEPGAQFPPNGLPVQTLDLRNDDGGPGYGADSRLDFVVPSDGEYLLHLQDVRGLGGPDFSYRLTVRDSAPDFSLTASPLNPNIPQGGNLPMTVTANRLEGYQGPIEVEVKGLPPGVTASPAVIPAGQDSTLVLLRASADAAASTQPAAIEILGRGVVDGRTLTRKAGGDAPLQVASIIPPPDLEVAAEPHEVTLEPGQEATVKLRIDRRNQFRGRVPCDIENLPPGIRVVNVGLNGVLVHAQENTQTFTLKAEDWAAPIDQPIYVVGEVESNSSTRHASAPILLKVRKTEVATTHTAGSAPNR